jgi:hypothetical protein
MIDLKNKVIYVHVPKTGGTSIEKYFLDLLGLETKDAAAIGVFKNLDKTSNLERGNQHCSLRMIEDYFFGGEIPSEFKIFSTVRNPYDRFYSELNYRRLPPPGRFPFSFRLPAHFLMFLAEKKFTLLKDLNSHMRPQYEYLLGKSERRVRLLRLENLQDEFGDLMREWGLYNGPLQMLNRSSVRALRSSDLVKCNEFIIKTYKEDFDRFGYKI